jgi:thioredoxin 1
MITELPEDQTLTDFVDDSSTIVYLTAPWCGPCRQYGPVLTKLSAEHPEVTVVKVDIDKRPEIAQELSVRSVPTTILYRDGKPAQTIVGARPKAFIEKEFGLA